MCIYIFTYVYIYISDSGCPTGRNTARAFLALRREPCNQMRAAVMANKIPRIPGTKMLLEMGSR